MKNLLGRVDAWMRRNLEDPFLKAEMARAVPSRQRDRASTAVHVSVAGGLVIMICWVLFLAI